MAVAEPDFVAIRENNLRKAGLCSWLDQKAPLIFEKLSGEYKFIAILDAPPQGKVFRFKRKSNLMDFLQANPVAAVRYRGFEQEIFML